VIFGYSKKKYYNIRGGNGVPVRKIGNSSFVLNHETKGIEYPPWDITVDAVQKQVYIGKGYVNQLEPLIDELPISGIYPDGKLATRRPFLQFDGMQCVLLKIRPGVNGEIKSFAPYLADSSSVFIELGVLSDAQAYDPECWTQPLAIISDAGKLQQLSFFNYKYQASRPRGKDFWRHFITAEPVFSRSIQDKLNNVTTNI
jgi:hypothetical protein